MESVQVTEIPEVSQVQNLLKQYKQNIQDISIHSNNTILHQSVDEYVEGASDLLRMRHNLVAQLIKDLRNALDNLQNYSLEDVEVLVDVYMDIKSLDLSDTIYQCLSFFDDLMFVFKRKFYEKYNVGILINFEVKPMDINLDSKSYLFQSFCKVFDNGFDLTWDPKKSTFSEFMKRLKQNIPRFLENKELASNPKYQTKEFWINLFPLKPSIPGEIAVLNEYIGNIGAQIIRISDISNQWWVRMGSNNFVAINYENNKGFTDFDLAQIDLKALEAFILSQPTNKVRTDINESI